jgi:hypothetical protein
VLKRLRLPTPGNIDGRDRAHSSFGNLNYLACATPA